MKKTLLLSFLFLTFFAGQSQINHFSNGDAKWFVRNTFMDGSPYQPSFIGVSTTVYGFKGDTIIAGKKWLKMYSSEDSSFIKDLKLEGYIYSNSEVVEFIDIKGELDTIYDFSIDKTDSIYFTFIYNQRPNQDIRPDSIDSISIGALKYKRISFKEPTGPSAMDGLYEKWIWGIGSIHGPLHPVYLGIYSGEDGDANETDLVCTHLADTLVYADGHLCFDVQKNNWKSWYQLGTTWYINNSYNFPNKIEQGYSKYTVVKDTVVGGLKAQYITGYAETNVHTEWNPIIVREENNRAYYWANNVFKLMFDFNLNAGDTLHKTGGDPDCDSGFVVVDSISSLTIGGETLKVQHLLEYAYYKGELLSNLFIGYTVTEKVGLIYNWTSGSQFIYDPRTFCGIADNFWHDGSLRCYEEPNGLYYNAKPSLSSCDVITSSKVIDELKITISPNPTSGIVYFNGMQEYVYYTVSDINGKQLTTGFSNQVNMSPFFKGIYLLSVVYQNKTYSQKIVKQ
jgi:hypothetical protein